MRLCGTWWTYGRRRSRSRRSREVLEGAVRGGASARAGGARNDRMTDTIELLLMNMFLHGRVDKT